MSEIIMSAEPAVHAQPKRTTAKTGAARRIRALKERYPEMSKAAIARKVGCNINNVSYVLKRYLGDTSEDELRQFREDKADIMESVQHRILASLTDKKIAKTSAVQAVTAVAILEDKIRLQRGQATGINVTVLMDVVEALRSKPAVPPGEQALNVTPSDKES